ncbi:MAG TPA: hypothetical protein VLH77_04325, partial [Gammaproteobacteria bacterium]|nr:hypothetical protein [Gammaproteobacteria bacterium]
VSTELNQFKLRRDQQNKLRDRLERLAVSLLYVVTLTLVDIQTSKAKVHHIINSINSAFSAYVASIHKSKNASLNNCSSFLISSKRYHVVLMNSIREAEILFPQDSELPRSNPQAARAKARAALPKASLLCFFKHSKNAALSLKNVKNLADQYSPEKINMLKRGS